MAVFACLFGFLILFIVFCRVFNVCLTVAYDAGPLPLSFFTVLFLFVFVVVSFLLSVFLLLLSFLQPLFLPFLSCSYSFLSFYCFFLFSVPFPFLLSFLASFLYLSPESAITRRRRSQPKRGTTYNRSSKF